MSVKGRELTPRSKHRVQAAITAVSFPASTEELRAMINKYEGYLTDIEELLTNQPEEPISWSAPRWMAAGDILFFYHTARSTANLRSVRRELEAMPRVNFHLAEALFQGELLNSLFARTIFACAEVVEPSYFQHEPSGQAHFRGRIFAPLGKVHEFESPLSLATFSSVVTLSPGGTLTPLHGRSLVGLKRLLARNNRLPEFLARARPATLGLRSVTKSNWDKVATASETIFVDESQLRAYWLDYLLQAIKDPGTPIYEECACATSAAAGRADYFVRVEGQWIAVEAKLNVSAERNVLGQMRKYCGVKAFVPQRGAGSDETVSVNPCRLALLADQRGLYLIANGRWRDCGPYPKSPLWNRTELTRKTVDRVRRRIAQELRRGR